MEPPCDLPVGWPARKWTVLLVHHTHTDVGYTGSQARIARHHAQFLDRAMSIAAAARGGEPAFEGFRWTNECFWSVEQWLRVCGAGRLDELVACIREGSIDLSATYLHFNELIDLHHAQAAVRRARAFADEHALPLDTALSADVNGFGNGYAGVLAEAGIRNLVTCVHSHHGLAPIGRRQAPFYWGNDVLVWNGEHYHLGNVLGLAPSAIQSYHFTDELAPRPRQPDNMAVAAVRLPRYLRRLEDDGYPYAEVPVHVSGAMSDNAPPSEHIAGFVHRWNERHGASIELRMGSLSAFCEMVRRHETPIPTFEGDWPDWWSDGLASSAGETALVREAMRRARWARALASQRRIRLEAPPALEENVLLAVEHTYGHSDAMKAPWDMEVKAVGASKKAFAAHAHEAAGELCDALFDRMGMQCPHAPAPDEPPFFYRAVNPTGQPLTDLASLCLESKDFDRLPNAPRVVSLRDGRSPACEVSAAPRGKCFEVPLALGAWEEADLRLEAGEVTLSSIRRETCDVSARDVAGAEAVIGTEGALETGFWRIAVSRETGIEDIRDLRSGVSLLADSRAHAPFVPVYERTPCGHRDPCSVRRGFGRNRKGPNVERHVGSCTSLSIEEGGPHRIRVDLEYQIEGAAWFHVHLGIWRALPRMDVQIAFLKTAVWDAENLYLSLPFAVPAGTLWIDKPGGPMRPWLDQLPDTLTDWYCIGEGFASCADSLGVCVATPDAPLLQLGPLDFGPRRLMGHPSLDPHSTLPFAWLLTNYWETNFDASLGGFHQFRFRVESGERWADPRAALAHCAALNAGIQVFRIPPPTAPGP